MIAGKAADAARHAVDYPVVSSFSAQLAVFAAPPVVTTFNCLVFILCCLAVNTQSHAGYCLAASLGNACVTFRTVAQTLTVWELAAGMANGILNSRIDLILYCTVFGKSTRHVNNARSGLVLRSCFGKAVEMALCSPLLLKLRECIMTGSRPERYFEDYVVGARQELGTVSLRFSTRMVFWS